MNISETESNNLKSNTENEYENNCLYDYIDYETDKDGEKDDIIVSDDEEDDNLDSEIQGSDNKHIDENDEIILKGNRRISRPFLNKYEYTRILATRTKQLSQGAKPMVKNHQNLTPKQIAEEEIKNNTIPLIIKRSFPNNYAEYWKISELKRQNF